MQYTAEVLVLGYGELPWSLWDMGSNITSEGTKKPKASKLLKTICGIVLRKHF